MIFTTRKLKTALTLKSQVERSLLIGVIHKPSFSSRSTSYVVESTRQIKTRVNEQKSTKSALERLLAECNTGAQLDGPEI